MFLLQTYERLPNNHHAAATAAGVANAAAANAATTAAVASSALDGSITNRNDQFAAAIVGASSAAAFKPGVKDAKDGHLIYENGDLIDNRCKQKKKRRRHVFSPPARAHINLFFSSRLQTK